MRVKRKIRFWLGMVVFLLLTGILEGKPVQAAEKKIVKVALGEMHSAAIDTEGGLWIWGSNGYGELGNGKRGENLCEGNPIKIMDGVTQVSLSSGSSDSHSGAVTRDGSLYMWGSNSFGQLGDGTTTDCLKPKKVMSGISQVIAGHRKTAVIKKDGSLWVWGYNGNNDLGTGDRNTYTIPVKILDNVVQADLGTSHGGAVKADGSLWMWGSGNGAKPVQVIDSGVKQLSLGHAHSSVVKTDGSLWMWGDNSWGQLGLGQTGEGSVKAPRKVMDGVSQVSLGYWESSILKQDGSAWMTGYNYYISFNTNVWKEIATGAKQIELGDTHAAMIKTDGSLWTWGGGWRGQLGDGVKNQDNHKVKKPARISVGEVDKPSNPPSGTGQNVGGGAAPSTGQTIGGRMKKALPKKNSTFKVRNITYKVTKSDAKKGTVTLLKSDKKKTTVVIPAAVKKNGYTFKVTQISGKAFYKDTKLKKVTFGKNITSVGTKAFWGCTSLKTVTMDKALVTIGDYAFRGCKQLTKLVVPVKVKTIGKEAFSKNSRLKTIQIKSTVLKKVGKKALSGIHKKAVIKVPSKKFKDYQKLLKKKGQASAVKIKK